MHELRLPTFDDPPGMLSACHDRMERQIATLERLQRHLPAFGHDAAAQGAARAILRYFDQAAPNHHADEEASVFPRLTERAPASRELVDALLRDHRALAAMWARLRPLLAAIAAGQRANLSPAQVREFARAYREHIAREDEAMIPMAQATLDAAQWRAVGEEMASRRGN